MDAIKLTINPQKSQIMIVNPKTRKQNTTFLLKFKKVPIPLLPFLSFGPKLMKPTLKFLAT